MHEPCSRTRSSTPAHEAGAFNALRTLDNSYRSMNSIQCSCLASAFGHSEDSILCPRFSMFSTISGNLLLARCKPRGRNYIGFCYISGTANLPKQKVTGCGGLRRTQNSINFVPIGDSSNGRGIRDFTFFGSWVRFPGQYILTIEPPRRCAIIRATEQLDLDDWSGRAKARSGLRMMPTFPLPSLKFRTAGFPQYGFKAGRSDRAFPFDASSPRTVCHYPNRELARHPVKCLCWKGVDHRWPLCMGCVFCPSPTEARFPSPRSTLYSRRAVTSSRATNTK
jgi:hypothetical protein